MAWMIPLITTAASIWASSKHGQKTLGTGGGGGGGGGSFLSGNPELRDNVSTLRPDQEALSQQAVQAGMNPGAGGAFGGAADYFRDLLSNNSADIDAFARPEIRKYNEDIVPGLSEQFAGMGSGGLSSSGFRNAQVQGATDLAERLGAIRAQLRNQGAQGLMNVGQAGLGNFTQNMTTQQPSQGAAPWLAQTGGNLLSQYASNWMNGGGGSGGSAGSGDNVGAGSGYYQSSATPTASVQPAGSAYSQSSFGGG